MGRYFFVIILFSIICCKNSSAQEEKEEIFRPHHVVGLSLSHAHVFNGRDENGNSKNLSLPAWGLDYTYQFHPRWGIGLHTDFIVERFSVEENLSSDKEIIERSYPVAPAIMAIYKLRHHWSFLFGAGAEFEKEENFFLNRAGVEYSGELPKGWEVFGLLSYDFKWNAYDTWIIGIGIAKQLNTKR